MKKVTPFTVDNKKQLPNLYDGGKTIFLAIGYPPNPAAAAVVHRLLLDQFNPESFVVLTGYFFGAKKSEAPNDVKKHFIYFNLEFLSSRLHRLIASIQKITIPLFLLFYRRKYGAKRVVIAYPDLYWLDICSKWAKKYRIIFVPYLHDTIVEGTYSTRIKKRAERVQERVFKHAYKVAVMSEGMKSLYTTKYGMETTAWEHIYPEQPFSFYGDKVERAHWSGDVYEINHNAVLRLSQAMKAAGKQLTISNGKTREQLSAQGIQGNHIEKVFYPKRADYLKHLSASSIVFLGLNYPDECEVHEDELSTIFSTKTPEYLASDALIIYHGPKHYFLSQFLLQNQCGLIISERKVDKLVMVINDVFAYPDKYQFYINNAKKALQKFQPDMVSKKVIDTLS